MGKKMCCLAVLLVCLTVLGGCKKTEKEPKIADLDFTVLNEEEAPQELKEIIGEKKQEPFKLTYSDSQFLYLVVGYGEQPTGGYSIQVNDLYLTENHIYLDADLMGPSKKEEVSRMPTWPCLIVKLEYRQESVVFDT